MSIRTFLGNIFRDIGLGTNTPSNPVVPQQQDENQALVNEIKSIINENTPTERGYRDAFNRIGLFIGLSFLLALTTVAFDIIISIINRSQTIYIDVATSLFALIVPLSGVSIYNTLQDEFLVFCKTKSKRTGRIYFNIVLLSTGFLAFLGYIICRAFPNHILAYSHFIFGFSLVCISVVLILGIAIQIISHPIDIETLINRWENLKRLFTDLLKNM